MAETQQARRLREYETIFLVRPELTDDNVDKIKDRVRSIINREGGKAIKFTIWGKKKTAYPVSKQPRAIYVHSLYLGGSALVAEVERNLRNLDEVTRFLSVKIADEIDPETRQVEEDVRMAGDVEEAPRTGGEREERGSFRGGAEAPEAPEAAAEEEETAEEA